MKAAGSGNIEICNLLLQGGCDHTLKEIRGLTAADYAELYHPELGLHT